MKAKPLSAFTLVELLVTIAIIAILAGLIVPALARAKLAARRIACGSNLKQWANGMFLYLHDYQEFFPRENAVDGINSWDDAIVSTNGDIWYNALPVHMGTRPLADFAAITANQMDFYYKASLFHCPSARFSGLAETYPNFSYAMNSKLMVPEANVVIYTALQMPTRTPFFIDTGVPGEMPIRGQKPYNGQPHAYASRFSARHGGSGNLAMADGHLETLRAEKVVDTNAANTNSYGKSIFPPVDVIWRPDPESNPNR